MKFHFVRFTNALFLLLLIGVLNQCKKAEQATVNKPNLKIHSGMFSGGHHVADLSPDGHIYCTYRNNTNGLTLMKTTPGGEHIYTREIMKGLVAVLPSVAVTPDGSIYLFAAAYKDFSLTKYDMLLVKCNAQGDTIWTRIYGSPLNEMPQLIEETNDGGLILCGRVEISFSNFSLWTIKLDANGKEEWNTFPNAEGIYSIFDAVHLQNGDIVLQGGNNSGGIGLYKINTSGQLLAQNMLHLSNLAQSGSMVESSENTILGTSSNGSDVVLWSTDDKLQLKWTKPLGYPDHGEAASCMTQNRDGSLTITGTTFGPRTNQIQDVVAMRVTESGELIWYRGFGGKGSEFGLAILKDSEDNNIIVGNINEASGSPTQIFTVLLDNDGNFK